MFSLKLMGKINNNILSNILKRFSIKLVSIEISENHSGFLMINNHVFFNKKIFVGSPVAKKVKLRRCIIHEGSHYKWRRD